MIKKELELCQPHLASRRGWCHKDIPPVNIRIAHINPHSTRKGLPAPPAQGGASSACTFPDSHGAPGHPSSLAS
eukprot:6211219-Pleurochrysis_carterae.AAC.1